MQVRKQGDSLPSVSIRRAMTGQLLRDIAVSVIVKRVAQFWKTQQSVGNAMSRLVLTDQRTRGNLLLSRSAKWRSARRVRFRNWYSLEECGFIKPSDEANAHFAAVGRGVVL